VCIFLSKRVIQLPCNLVSYQHYRAICYIRYYTENGISMFLRNTALSWEIHGLQTTIVMGTLDTGESVAGAVATMSILLWEISEPPRNLGKNERTEPNSPTHTKHDVRTYNTTVRMTTLSLSASWHICRQYCSLRGLQHPNCDGSKRVTSPPFR